MTENKAYFWPDDVMELCRGAARRHSVSPSVHLEDFIFRFIYDNNVFPSKAAAVNYYFNDGANSARKVRELIDRWMPSRKEALRILEFASGYGAVTRHAKKALESHVLHCSDIHEQANRFNEIEFEVTSVQSVQDPQNFGVYNPYDVIFALSFFSHMPISTWRGWLNRLYSCLLTGGVLIFTTHGELSKRYFPRAELDNSGFWFSPSSEQQDLDVAAYGQTVTSKRFVDDSIAELKGAEHLFFEQGGWWGHQDLYLIRKVN